MSLDNFDKNKNLGNVRPPRKIDDYFDLDKSKIEIEPSDNSKARDERRIRDDERDARDGLRNHTHHDYYNDKRRDDDYRRRANRDRDREYPSRSSVNVTKLYNEMENEDSYKDIDITRRKSPSDRHDMRNEDKRVDRPAFAKAPSKKYSSDYDNRRIDFDEDDFLERRERRRRVKKKTNVKGIIIFAIVELLTLIVIIGIGYITRINNLSQKVEFDKKEVRNTNIDSVKLETMKGYFTIAIFGVDSRTGDVGKGNNSDINIIANINVETGDIKLISIYRDTFLNITDGGSYGKMNAAYMYGGPIGAVKAINKNLDLNIENYITFNWKAVANAIDLLGGIDIEITRSEFKYMNSFIHETCRSTGIFYDNPAAMYIHSYGPLHLNGVQAVAYGRLRLMDSDFQRVDRQRKVIIESLKAAKKMSFIQLSAILDLILPQIAYEFDMTQALTLARNISGFNVSETIGFPTNFTQQEMGKSGDCIIPKSLATNVAKLHSTVFGDEGYSPSSAVHTYSNRIVALTGQYAQEAENNKASQESSSSALTSQTTTNTSSTNKSTSTTKSNNNNKAPYESANEETSSSSSTNSSNTSFANVEPILSDNMPVLQDNTNTRETAAFYPGSSATTTNNNQSPTNSGQTSYPGMNAQPQSPANSGNTSSPVSPGSNSPQNSAPLSPSNPQGTVSPGSVSPGSVSPGSVSPGSVSPGSAYPGSSAQSPASSNTQGVAIPYPGAAIPVQAPGAIN